VLGYGAGPVPLIDRCLTGHAEGQWHFIVDCPYSFMMNQSTPYTEVAPLLARTNGHVTFPATTTLVTGGVS